MIWVLLASSCSQSKANLNRTYLPNTFDVSSIIASRLPIETMGIIVIHINDKPKYANIVSKYWVQGDYNGVFEKEHPVVNLDRNAISVLKHALRDVFDIFYLKLSSDQLQPNNVPQLKKKIRCKPLSNLEIRFLMNSGIENAFPQKPLTMLFVSALEILTIKGAIPIYPSVHSPYLRSQHQMQPLRTLKNLNLAEKSDPFRFPSGGSDGLIFCRKSDKKI